MSSPVPVDEVYTAFSRFQQRVIIFLLSTATLASPLAATMYLPLLPLLSKQFHVSAQAINLTITVYIVFQALSPLLLAGVSDYFGRRPIYLGTFTIFMVASLGLALNNSSFIALIVLRALQSLGASAILSINYGTVADICVPAERGQMLGAMLVAGNVGTCVGPLIGGIVASTSGSYHWAFWAMCIFAGYMLLSLALFLPETARNVVGNGSIEDHLWNRPVWRILQESISTTGKRWERDAEPGDSQTPLLSNFRRDAPTPTRTLKFGSLIASFRILFFKDTPFIIWLSSSYYALWYCIQASIPRIYKAPPYSFTDFEIGMAYLPGSVGVILSMYVSGRFMDWTYKSKAKQMGFIVDKFKEDDLAKFPIEEARSRWSGFMITLTMCVLGGYGWAIQQGAHFSVPLILQFILGFIVIWLTQVFAVLLVDTFPETPSTAATTTNMTRCVLAAAAVATLQPLVSILGHGWFFTLLGLVSGIVGLAALFVLRRWGMAWRVHRREAVLRRLKPQAEQGPLLIDVDENS